MFVYTGLGSTDSAKADTPIMPFRSTSEEEKSKKIKTDELTVKDEVKKVRRRKQSKRGREGKRGSLKVWPPL